MVITPPLSAKEGKNEKISQSINPDYELPQFKIDVITIIGRYDWDVNTATAIFMAESGLNPTSVSKTNRNGTRDYGVAQINSIHKGKVSGDINQLLDPETNIRVAYEIYKGRGNFSAWSAFNNKRYLKYKNIIKE